MFSYAAAVMNHTAKLYGSITILYMREEWQRTHFRRHIL